MAVLAVDPSSPFSGGSLLGDRVRMRDLMEHPEIFIRSMASRGALGGLARAAGELVLALEAAGFDLILVEDGRRWAVRSGHRAPGEHHPGSRGARPGRRHPGRQGRHPGDRRHPGGQPNPTRAAAESAARALAAMLEIGAELKAGAEKEKDIWKVPVCQTSALNRAGIAELAETISQHRAWLRESGEWERRAQIRLEDLFNRLLRERLYQDWQHSQPQANINDLLQALRKHETSPYRLIERLFS